MTDGKDLEADPPAQEREQEGAGSAGPRRERSPAVAGPADPLFLALPDRGLLPLPVRLPPRGVRGLLHYPRPGPAGVAGGVEDRLQRQV